jgi:8-amino-7-oxononanoate synthase
MPLDKALERRLRARLEEWRAGGLHRVLRPPAGVDFSSNDYLNLAAHPRVTARFAEAVAREGCGSTGSRLLRGDRARFAAVEERFAKFKGVERALYFSSGYLANLAVLTTLPEAGDVIFSDERNHASLIDGCRLSRARVVVFPHGDVPALEALMEKERGPVSHVQFLVTESLFSMDGDFAPLAAYDSLCRRTGAALVVDEAHAVGVYGAGGSGLVEADCLAGTCCVTINTAGKALGVAGAFVAGPAWAIEHLVQRARPFVFSTAPPPALAHALDESLSILAEEPERRERLHARVTHLRERLSALALPVPPRSSQIVPVIIGDNEAAVAVAVRLQDEGFDVRAIRPPTVPRGTARLRVSVNVGLSEAIIDRFTAALVRGLKETGVSCAASS